MLGALLLLHSPLPLSYPGQEVTFLVCYVVTYTIVYGQVNLALVSSRPSFKVLSIVTKVNCAGITAITDFDMVREARISLYHTFGSLG